MDLEYKLRILLLKEAAIILDALANKLESERAKAQAKESVKAVAWAAMELTKAQQVQTDLMGVIESQKQTADALIKKLKKYGV